MAPVSSPTHSWHPPRPGGEEEPPGGCKHGWETAQHDLAREGAGADITVRLGMGARAQGFWGNGQASPSFPPWSSVQQEGFWESLGLRTLEARGLSLLGMWRAVAGELKYLVTSGCPLQEGATNMLASVAYLSTWSPG